MKAKFKTILLIALLCIAVLALAGAAVSFCAVNGVWADETEEQSEDAENPDDDSGEDETPVMCIYCGGEMTKVMLKPDCTHAGKTNWVCFNCSSGYEVVGDTIPALGHDYYVVAEKTFSCTEDGYTVYGCTRCSEEWEPESMIVPAHHVLKETVHEASCSGTGYTVYSCENCSYSYVDDYVDPLGHDYVGTPTAETCTTQGYTTYVCSRCGYTYIDDYVAATGHTWGEGTFVISTVNEETGEVEIGYTVYYCETCGEPYITNYVNSGDDGYVHNYVYEVVEPDCEHEGYTIKTCTIHAWEYDVVEGSYVPALGHNYETVTYEPDCENEGYTTYTCTRCGDYFDSDFKDALGHSYKLSSQQISTISGVFTTTYVCSVCGDDQTDNLVLNIEDANGNVTSYDFENGQCAIELPDTDYTTYVIFNDTVVGVRSWSRKVTGGTTEEDEGEDESETEHSPVYSDALSDDAILTVTYECATCGESLLGQLSVSMRSIDTGETTYLTVPSNGTLDLSSYEGEFALVITDTESGQTLESVTITIENGMLAVNNDEPEPDEPDESAEEEEESGSGFGLSTQFLVMLIIVVIVILAAIIILIVIHRKKKNK